MEKRPGTHAISGRVTNAAGRGLAGVRVESGFTHFAVTGPDGRYILRGLIDGSRVVTARGVSHTVVLSGAGAGADFKLPR